MLIIITTTITATMVSSIPASLPFRDHHAIPWRILLNQFKDSIAILSTWPHFVVFGHLLLHLGCEHNNLSQSNFKYPQPPCSLASSRSKALLFCNVRLSYWITTDRFIGMIPQGIGCPAEARIGRQAVMLDRLYILANPWITVNIKIFFNTST